MEESLNKKDEEGDLKRDVIRKRKALVPWKFQSGYKRWPNGLKARKIDNSKKFDCVEDLGGLSGGVGNRKNLDNAQDSADLNANIRNGERFDFLEDLGISNEAVKNRENLDIVRDLGDLNGETLNNVEDLVNLNGKLKKGEKLDKPNNLDGMNSKFDNCETPNNVKDSVSLNRKFENGETINNAKNSSNLNGCANKTQIMSKLHKALAPRRFEIGYNSPFSEEISKRKALKNTYPQRKYPSSVRVSASCKFSPDLKNGKSDGFLKKGQSLNFEKNSIVRTRDSVMGNLRKFQCIYRELLTNGKLGLHGIDIMALKCFRERNNLLYKETKKYTGTVPGTQVGDVFHLMVELVVVGLHAHTRSCVDFIKQEDENLAISVVKYGNQMDLNKKIKIDLVEFRGSSYKLGDSNFKGSDFSLSLIKSMETKSPVRLIYGIKKFVSVTETKCKKNVYIYCGLYNIEKSSKKKSNDGTNFEYVFSLKRVTGQPDLDLNEILESRRLETCLFPNFYLEDISMGKEKVPITVVNFINDEKPPFFNYITVLKPKTLLVQNTHPSNGCNCLKGCKDSKTCACVVKNGGEIPFNNEGLIIEAKPLVYECGPFCKCPPSCTNRVGQHGMKYKLQVFKTEKMGWGVRSINFIPSGSFVCEYIGELLNDEEAQNRDNDEYLFSIGNNYYDEKLWEGLKTSIPALQKNKNREMESFAIDASEFGNFARFINHSCEPNMYAQNLLYDHDNLNMPRIMFFACEDIKPMEELTYHYNYCVDQVHDANGNIKKKKCFCGTSECTGWLY